MNFISRENSESSFSYVHIYVVVHIREMNGMQEDYKYILIRDYVRSFSFYNTARLFCRPLKREAFAYRREKVMSFLQNASIKGKSLMIS